MPWEAHLGVTGFCQRLEDRSGRAATEGRCTELGGLLEIPRFHEEAGVSGREPFRKLMEEAGQNDCRL
jgi:hypothetical protein